MSDASQAKSLLDEIANERKKGSQIRLASAGAVLAMFAIFAGSVYNRIQSFDTDALLVGLQESASATVWPMVSRQLDEVGNAAVPALSAAMTDEMEAFGPRLVEQLNTESEVLQNNLNGRMKTSLDGHLSEQFSSRKAELKGKLEPFASDDAMYDDMARRLQASAQDWAQDELDTTFTEHIHILQSINETVGQLGEQAREDRAENGDVTVDDFMLLMTEILNARVNEAG
jgi:hypothetical protein